MQANHIVICYVVFCALELCLQLESFFGLLFPWVGHAQKIVSSESVVMHATA